MLETGSLVHIYFKELGIMKYSRDELYTLIDVICKHLFTFCLFTFCTEPFIAAAFGGIVGLCMGFSLLSGVEFLYWFSIRIFFDKLASDKKKSRR